ncbi:hypothetical protein AGMMS49975_19500 [Clostridia bacterium]|nr:hypothetical protein AGMMS49975_19500 [Clostridia bacterium]
MKGCNKGLTPFGREIKKYTIDRGITIAEFAEAVGADDNYLSQIMHGRKSGRKYIKKIRTLLGNIV